MNREIVEKLAIQATIEKIATALVASEGKELQRVALFTPEDALWPEGVFGLGKYFYLDTPDGTVQIVAGDYIVQTLDNQRYRIHLETTR